VVVAAANIGPLSQPKIEQLRVVEWPTAALPKGTFQRTEDVIKTGKLNINAIVEGEPILEGRLSTPDKGLGMSQMVEPNKRAFVVKVEDSVATAEIMHPGALVDVVATLVDPKTHDTLTKTIVQNVQVVAVGDSIDVERSEVTDKSTPESHSERLARHRVVTLMVNLSEVELMTFASRYGQIDLALRNNNDSEVVATPGVTMDKIMGRSRRVDDRAAGTAASSNEATPLPGPGPRLPHSGRSHSSSSASHGPSIIKVNR
jgi:pilus assembly protein CpaB